MKKIDKYIQEFLKQEYNVEKITNSSALFSKNKRQFVGKVKWGGKFEITELSDYDNIDKADNHLKIYIALKDKGYVDDSTFAYMIDSVNDTPRSELIKLIYGIEKDAKVKLVSKSKSGINKFKYLLVIIPKSSRAEFISDLQSIIEDMKADECSKFYIWFIVVLHILSVAYHAFFFKLKGYFYPNKQQSNKD